jgi:hypothetical protein
MVAFISIRLVASQQDPPQRLRSGRWPWDSPASSLEYPAPPQILHSEPIYDPTPLSCSDGLKKTTHEAIMQPLGRIKDNLRAIVTIVTLRNWGPRMISWIALSVSRSTADVAEQIWLCQRRSVNSDTLRPTFI